MKDVRFVRETIWSDLQARAPHPENEQPEKRVRLPKRLKKSVDLPRSHPSTQPSPR